ncbi:MAG: Hypothetical protein of L-Asparaginase type 2-like superfamily [uncultured Thermomicrobiales bacterium]|uniref:Asparaginase n=1 Tax=uncultured Thermomicrobiales bacterium TaxID=1645740 RepID=A0A6J4UG73_9BACT|nr:MAG: Hypothetical protein of L-Asparaginase type 2-like superfamily [uncultured Thermomicrobiales bacterium]
MSTVIAQVTRGNLVESQHHGTVVVADTSGKVVASAGDPDERTYFRSSGKPFQAVPLVESGAADRFRFSEAELALACASHDAAPWQQQAVAGMLTKIGLGPAALRCGSAPPYDEDEAARVRLKQVAPSPLHSDCSGKHTGMLATCVHLGYPIDSYLEADHPLQRTILEVMAAVLRLPADQIDRAPDGCSVPTFGAPIGAFAVAYATLARPDIVEADAGGSYAVSLNRLRTAMGNSPQHVGGPNNLDTALMEVTRGRVVAKLGAEGLLCLAIADEGLGIAVSVLDGSARARSEAAFAALDQLGLLRPGELASLRDRQTPAVTNFNGWTVGEIRSSFDLRR